ncbi:lytic transglycosylase domain-containing protein [Donghicola sp. XS_ASV15]|uniref:lytic transglycosylase domain-containing protein n=1 Tax=Donghicola sp. XS_ASV15 TaxID=3241295 RepID=UPI0035133C93
MFASSAFADEVSENSVERTNPKPFPIFTFKSVKPPKPGEAPKIDIQIPLDAEQEAEESPASAPPTGPQARFAWYWEQVSTSIADADPGRIEDALAALRGPKGEAVPAPRLAAIQEMAAPYTRTLMIETIGTQVSPAFALAVMWVESTGRKDAISSAGAQGLMQLIPATAERFGVSDSFDPIENIRGGVKYLDFLLRTFSGDPVLALAGYNAGENAVLRAQGIPEYDETRDYVPKVLAAFSIAKGLCKTPPVYVSDGCVFRSFDE